MLGRKAMVIFSEEISPFYFSTAFAFIVSIFI